MLTQKGALFNIPAIRHRVFFNFRMHAAAAGRSFSFVFDIA